jgi:hypothetical protein
MFGHYDLYVDSRFTLGLIWAYGTHFDLMTMDRRKTNTDRTSSPRVSYRISLTVI